jgi:GNAT superfamily N-acetyltransferase
VNTREIRVKFERLKISHDVGHFASSNAEMNTWLQTDALTAQYAGDLYTTVAVVQDSPVVVGYMAICRYQVLPVDHPPLADAPEPTLSVPGVLLSRLAVDRTMEGRGIGTALLVLAMKEAAVMGKSEPWQFLMLDAINPGVVGFYARLGFIELPHHPNRLYMSANDVEAFVATL